MSSSMVHVIEHKGAERTAAPMRDTTLERVMSHFFPEHKTS